MAGVALAVVKRAYTALSKDDIAVFAFCLGSADTRSTPVSASHPETPPPCTTALAAIPSVPQAPATPPPTAATVAPGTALGAGILRSERPAAGLRSRKAGAAGHAAGAPSSASASCLPGLYSHRASREAAAGAPADHGSCTETPRTNDGASCIDEEVTAGEGMPVSVQRGKCGWRFGSAVQWGVLLAAAVAGIAVCACRRRR